MGWGDGSRERGEMGGKGRRRVQHEENGDDEDDDGGGGWSIAP